MPDLPEGGATLARPAGRYQEPTSTGDVGQGTPRAPWLVALAALSLLVDLMYSRSLFADSYYDLYAGRYIVQHGIPHHNVVTVASHGARWIDQQWLAHVIYYGAWVAGGYPALAIGCALLVTSGFAVLGLVMLGRGIPPTRMFLWTAAAIIVWLGNIVIRAQSFAYPLFALTLWLVVSGGREPRLRARTWLVVPVLVLWANTHGSVLIGAGMVVLYAGYRAVAALRRGVSRHAGDRHGSNRRGDGRPEDGRSGIDRHGGNRQRGYRAVLGYLLLGVAAAASVLATPYGTGVIYYYKAVSGATPALGRYVTEWQRPDPLYLVSMGFFALLVAVVIAVAVAWRRGTRPDPLLAAIALVMLVLALTAIRNQAFFGMAGSLLAADTMARSRTRRMPVLSAAFSRLTAAALVAAALTGAGLIATEPGSTFESLVPVRAIGAAAALTARDPAARVLADGWSSPPLLWLHPGTFGRVGFDARLEQYSVAQLSSYAGYLTATRPGWQRLLRGYDVALVSRQHHDWLGTALARLPGWRVVYSGHDGLVLARGLP
jgi:hypothetical protein